MIFIKNPGAFELEVAHFAQEPAPELLVSSLNKKFQNGIFHSAYEAGFCGTSTHNSLLKLGFENIIINPADLPATDKEKKNKTDLHDSRAIARYLEKGLLHPIHILSNEQQELRSLYRFREIESRERTRALNRLKSFLMFRGIKVPENFAGSIGIPAKMLAWLDKITLSTTAGTLCLQQYIQTYKDCRSKLNYVTQELKRLVEKMYPQAYTLLLSVPGFGPIISMALLSEIGDFNRFDNPDQYCCYLGMVPWEHSSGESLNTKGMQPRCNSHLRPLLVEAAWAALRRDSTLLLYYKKHFAKGSKHAIMKVARKLALIAKGVISHKTPYDSEYLQNRALNVFGQKLANSISA